LKPTSRNCAVFSNPNFSYKADAPGIRKTNGLYVANAVRHVAGGYSLLFKTDGCVENILVVDRDDGFRICSYPLAHSLKLG